MAHFAKLGAGNIVVAVHIVSNDIATTEQAGIDFLNNLYKSRDIWRQTSYNTYAGEHSLGGTPFRKNFAGVGYHYDQTKDAFIPPQPYNSWTLNETTCIWDPPVAYPSDGKIYIWNETTRQWELNE
jgi:hypothetical protein|tara:strand:+ start:230 stop:607 length:378 start_codon:yes stop_codon:yes gene_type:complete